MDENTPRRPLLSFTIRDLLWAMVVVALISGWWADRARLTALLREYRLWHGAVQRVLTISNDGGLPTSGGN